METGTTAHCKKANTATSTRKTVGAVMARLGKACSWDNVSFVMYESDHKQRVMAVLEARKAPRGDCDANRVRIATGLFGALVAKKLGVANVLHNAVALPLGRPETKHNAVALSLGRHENKHSGLR